MYHSVTFSNAQPVLTDAFTENSSFTDRRCVRISAEGIFMTLRHFNAITLSVQSAVQYIHSKPNYLSYVSWSLNVRDFNLSWSPILVPLLQALVTGLDKTGWRLTACQSSPPSYCSFTASYSIKLCLSLGEIDCFHALLKRTLIQLFDLYHCTRPYASLQNALANRLKCYLLICVRVCMRARAC